jgi:hypothetical protein
MSVRQAIHDGDSAQTDPDGNISVRLLGVDAAEVSFTLPDRPASTFISIKSPEWTAFLTDPFAPGFPPFDPPLSIPLIEDLTLRLGPASAPNHARHADAAARAFEDFVEQDVNKNGKTKEVFRFFIAFATDVIDRYGRFLAFLNEDLPTPPRLASYNERLLATGQVTPYFIWPNINPFRLQPNLVDAVPDAGQPITDPSLDAARRSVRSARAGHRGIFDRVDPLRLMPFELRYLARVVTRGDQRFRSGPDRWVIDLSAADDRLLSPQRYIEIAHAEDRLFVPAEYVPLFVNRGWKAQEPG